jgi:TRAP-type C4-dicarboxylate transport system permease small subunit
MREPSGFRRRLRQLLQAVVLLLMTALAVVVVVGVGFRKAGAALVWYDEAASILLAWLTFYGACLAALEHAHIGFPQVVAALGPRARKGVVLVREICVVGFFVVLAGAGLRVQQVLIGTYLVSMPSIPTGVAHSVIPIGALLFVLAELSTVGDRLRGEPDTVLTPAAATGSPTEDRP